MAPARLDELIHQPVRLQILSALYRNRQASFTSLRDGLGLTAGNLASHSRTLEAAGYLTAGRTLTPHGFELRYRITTKGSEAFRTYVAAIAPLLSGAEDSHARVDR